MHLLNVALPSYFFSCHWQPHRWAAGSMSQPWERSNSLDYRSGPAGVHLTYMSRKWWRSKAHVATSPATSAPLMKSGLWFAGCLVHFRLLGYQRWGSISACLKFVSATVSLSACSKIGNTAYLQTVFPSWKLWSPMLSHHREKILSTFSIVAPVQEKIIFIAGCSFCLQFVSLLR